MIEIAKYHNNPVIKQDLEVLIKLELLVKNPIPKVPMVGLATFGFSVHENRVVQLGLYETGLKSLPDNIGGLTSLTSLYLKGNQLTSLPDSIGQLKSLKILDLGCNLLSTLPESIGKLKSLEKLILNYNRLSALPESIGEIKTLRNLNLKGNMLTYIDESIGKLKSLQTLIIETKLTTLPEAIYNLKSLRFFSYTLDNYDNSYYHEINSKMPWVSYKNLIDIDAIISNIIRFLYQFETRCISGCCGIEAFDFTKARIEEVVKKFDIDELVNEITNVIQKLELISEPKVGSDFFNQSFPTEDIIDLMKEILENVQK